MKPVNCMKHNATFQPAKTVNVLLQPLFKIIAADFTEYKMIILKKNKRYFQTENWNIFPSRPSRALKIKCRCPLSNAHRYSQQKPSFHARIGK